MYKLSFEGIEKSDGIGERNELRDFFWEGDV